MPTDTWVNAMFGLNFIGIIVAFAVGAFIGAFIAFKNYQRKHLSLLVNRLEQLEGKLQRQEMEPSRSQDIPATTGTHSDIPDSEEVLSAIEISEAETPSLKSNPISDHKTVQSETTGEAPSLAQEEGPAAQAKATNSAPSTPLGIAERPTGELTNKIISTLDAIDRQETEAQSVTKRTLLHIKTNLKENISVSKLASKIFVSPRTLQRSLKEELGASPSEIVLAVKMHEAKKLLRRGKLMVSEVGYEVGFENPNHFSRRFKQHYGIAPSTISKISER